MSVLGIIAEYNPFHYGHKYHIQQSKKITSSKYTVVVMSGSFVQRGEPAFIDKWSRAKMAILNGVDLVIELPFAYSCQTAELFAEGAIKTLDSLNIIDYLSFGSEAADLYKLDKIAETLVIQDESFRTIMKDFLRLESSYAVSRNLAIGQYLGMDFLNILKSPNNILGIEYLKALKTLESPIKPITLGRRGPGFKSENLEEFSSATALRKIGLVDHKKIEAYVPRDTYTVLEEFLHKYGSFNQIKNFESILLYLLRTKPIEEIEEIFDAEYGLGRRILKEASLTSNLEDIVLASQSKTHTITRVQRVLMHILLDLKKDQLEEIRSGKNTFIRVLGANNKGLELLRTIKNKSELEIISKFSNYEKSTNPLTRKTLNLEKMATDIYFLPFKTAQKNMDYYRSPVIIQNKKE